jgi:hypothetical protein
MPKGRVLEGGGPDGMPYHVTSSKGAFIISFGTNKRGRARLPAETRRSELSHDAVVRRIQEAVTMKRPADMAELHVTDTATAEEGRRLSTDIPEKRARAQAMFQTALPADAGANAAVNRDFEAERDRRRKGWLSKERQEWVPQDRAATFRSDSTAGSKLATDALAGSFALGFSSTLEPPQQEEIVKMLMLSSSRQLSFSAAADGCIMSRKERALFRVTSLCTGFSRQQCLDNELSSMVESSEAGEFEKLAARLETTTWFASGAFLWCASKGHPFGAAEVGPPFPARTASK